MLIFPYLLLVPALSILLDMPRREESCIQCPSPGISEEASAFALDLAQIHRAELTLLHVLDSDVQAQINPERTFSWAEHALRSLIPPIQDLRFATQTQVTSGNLVESVVHTAAAIAADWIVLGVDGTLPFWRFRDTAAYKVLARADCPVLTIRHAPCGSRPIRERSKRIEGVIA